MRDELTAALTRGASGGGCTPDSDELGLQTFVQEYGATVLAATTTSGFNIFDWIRPSAGVGDVHQVHQQAGAFDVPQELCAQPGSGVRAFNQARDICYDKTFLIRWLTYDGYAKVGL